MLRIAIDAGHYKGTPGRRCLAALDPAQTGEWELNRRVADKLEELLAGYDCQVLRVDDRTGDRLIDLGDRVAAANGWPADVYLSIHHNAGIKGGSGGGCVVYTAPSCQAKSKALQKAVYGAVVSRTGLVGNRATPMAERSLYVLQRTTMPAILIECGFMDSRTDVPVILTSYFAEQVADGLLAALVEVFDMKERKKVRERMSYTKRGGAHIVEVPVRDFAVWLVDKAKKTAYSGNYCNAGFFGNYNEGRDKFTLPVGHTVATMATDNKWVNHYCGQRGKVSGGKLVYAEPGRTETTLFVRGGLADMGEVSAPPEGCAYAIAGVPVLRQGKAVSWAAAKAQGWEASSLYATWHIFAGYGQDRSKIMVVALRTTTGNLISSGEGAKKLAALGLREAIKLDGGGSTILRAGGKTPVCTAGNRRICTVLTFEGNPYTAPTKALVKGNRGEGVRWLQWELNDRGFHCSVDGSFGPGTKEALMAYQVSAGLVPDGSCGPATRKALMG
nr:MAG TPA: Cell wall hydrolase autolysin [Caudoviricetes sp.]